MTPRNDTDAKAQNEVDAVRWLIHAHAIETLTYPRDQELVRSLSSP
jgi:hypothetical protein